MRSPGRLWIGACCATLALVSACATNLATDAASPTAPVDNMRPVSAAMLQDPLPGDWLQWGRTYDGENFSPLKSINRENVNTLAPAWSTPVQAGLAMPTPLVHDGVMFLLTSPDTLMAVDAANGSVLWKHAYTPQGVSSTMKMGVGLSGGRVFVPTSDLHVQALDAKTGTLVWDHEIAIYPPAVKGTTLGLRSAPESQTRLEEMSLEEVEAFLIRKAMARCGNVSNAARALGLSRSALYRRLERYRL